MLYSLTVSMQTFVGKGKYLAGVASQSFSDRGIGA